MKVHVVHEANIEKTPRVAQVSSMFDVPLEKKMHAEWSFDMPLDEREWNVGLIVGPSGSGKTTIARQLWPKQIAAAPEWPADKPVVDAFPAEMSVKDVVGLFTAVGFSSPPSWMRPFGTLSNGEQFRVQMARVLADGDDPTVVDEFTSVVDRQVAKVVSHTVQKAARRQGRKLILLSCHYDVIDWLQPDWIVQPEDRSFRWRSVQPRPQLEFAIHPVDRTAWPLFRHHHYLSGDLAKDARCFGAFAEGRIVAFNSSAAGPGSSKGIEIGHRMVVLPDWQGLGLGGRFDDWLGQWLWERGIRYRNTISHPSMIRHYQHSPRWSQVSAGRTPYVKRKAVTVKRAHASLRAQAYKSRFIGSYCFEYIPPAGAYPVGGPRGDLL